MAKRAARRSQALRINTAQALPTCPRCQRLLRARIGLIGHLRTQCNNNPTTSTSATPASDPTMTTTPTTASHFADAPPPRITNAILSPPLISSITMTNTTCLTPTTSVCTSNTTTAPSTSDGDSALTCPHCDRTFTSHIGLIGHLRLHRTETVQLVPVTQTHRRGHRLQFPHCPRAFTHRMGLLGHMRIHESGIHRDAHTFNTLCASINTSHSPPMSLNNRTSSRVPLPLTQYFLTYPVFIVTAHAHHAAAWSVTCESIAQRPANQC
ncbi:unnamed protein product [Schistocephalus solidus]|uniref:C2H2-type domain-containing protein n=1 Tax=Schistocephalus solidus TaxID=70667 RepID=A0A183TFB6_SCHSO|nr:unnamed protein product [Schistocephalus solidus]